MIAILTRFVYLKKKGRRLSKPTRDSYDSPNRMTNVTDWDGRKTTITYDLASRVTSITRPNNTIRLINYDADGETTNIVEKTLNNFPIAFFTLNWTNPGLVAWEFAAPLPHSNSVPTRTMTFDADNRLYAINAANVVNDQYGNLTWGPMTNDTFASYDYDARKRLVGTTSSSSRSYGYDPAGNRTSITNGASITRFIINPNA